MAPLWDRRMCGGCSLEVCDAPGLSVTVVSSGQLPIGRGGSARLSSTNRIMGRATTDRSLPNGEYHTFSRIGLHRTCLKRTVECIFVSERVETMGSRAAPSGSTPFRNRSCTPIGWQSRSVDLKKQTWRRACNSV